MLQILHILLWNACLATGLAIAIFLAQRIRHLRFHPSLWHTLWLLVLLKLATPPIFTVPVSVGSIRTEQHRNDHLASTLPFEGRALSSEGVADETFLTKAIDAILTARFAVGMSAIGTIALLLVSLSRVRQIGRLVRHAEPAPQWMQEAAAAAARQLELKRVPSIRTVDGIVAPFLWAAPRGPIVVMPCRLVAAFEPDSVRLIIKHELAHYARRDHWTNSFAMVLGALFWWNPVVWWARRELRILQESCCDRMVLAPDSSQRQRYAEALLKTIDFVASDDAAFPSPATAFASCATFKRRLEMTVSETPNRVHSRWLQACVLLCAMVVLPIGLTYAQDYEAVAKRLKAAVEAGELTGGQARVMLGTLKKMAQKDGEKDELNAYFEEVWAKLQAAVKEGKMSAEDAEAKMGAIKKAKFGAGKKDAYYKAIGQKIEAAVKAGKLTEEEAKAKWAAIKKAADAKKDQGSDRAKAYLAKVKKELGAAVEAGKISKEDAIKRYEGAEKAIKARMAGARGERSITVEEYKRAEAKMRKMVEDGKAKPEDVERRLIEMRKMMGERGEGDGRKADRERFAGMRERIEGAVKAGKITREQADAAYKGLRERLGRSREGDAKRSATRGMDWEGIKRRIEGAVKGGKMTREQADAAYKSIKERMGQRGEGDAKRGDALDIDWEGIKKRIEGAVKSGKMTREEADAKYKEIRERMAGRRQR